MTNRTTLLSWFLISSLLLSHVLEAFTSSPTGDSNPKTKKEGSDKATDGVKSNAEAAPARSSRRRKSGSRGRRQSRSRSRSRSDSRSRSRSKKRGNKRKSRRRSRSSDDSDSSRSRSRDNEPTKVVMVGTKPTKAPQPEKTTDGGAGVGKTVGGLGLRKR